jgi:hypothetical protein
MSEALGSLDGPPVDTEGSCTQLDSSGRASYTSAKRLNRRLH